MKKLVTMLVIAVMSFSLVACGGEGTPNTDDSNGTQQDAEQTGTTNNATTDGSTETENTEPTDESTETENTEPQYETVELTLENWNEYFEFTNELHFCRNEFDEIWRIDNIFYLKLKPEYEERCLGSDDEFAMKIEWTETTLVDANINYEDETCELLEEPEATDGRKTKYALVVNNIGDFKTSFFEESKKAENPGYFMHYPYDFEVTNIKGLLYIEKESE